MSQQRSGEMIDRRTLLAAGGLAAAPLPVTGAAEQLVVQSPSVRPPAVTRTLCDYIVNVQHGSLPQHVRKEGLRSLLNWVGVTIGGSRHETVQIAARALAEFAGKPQAVLLGRAERLDVLNAAFINGVSSHIFDYDDTHLRTIIHPAGPVAPAALALAEYLSAAGRPVNGQDFLNAFVLGIEVECRIGSAVYPNHYDAGWHITGTAGVFGSAAASSKLLGLDRQRTAYALGLAASQPVGLRESFGSMNKSFNPGRAASNGVFAALLAEKGFTSSEAMIEAKRGWANVVSTKQDYREITEGLGSRFESAFNTYKPFACGIVLHPIIDAIIGLSKEHRISAPQIRRIDLQVNPLVLELTGKAEPRTGLEGKFSVYHAAAISVIAGAAGEKQFSDAAVRDPSVVALSKRVVPVTAPKIAPEQADVIITLTNGRRFHRFVEHAIGSLQTPMSDLDLERKFTGLCEDILPLAQARRIMDMCWKVEGLLDVAALPQACAAS